MDPALNQNQPELGISVLPVPLKMLPDGDCLLDKMVAVLGQLWSHALALQNAQNLVASDETDLHRPFTQVDRMVVVLLQHTQFAKPSWHSADYC